jgi:hypothetical protein
MQISSRLRAVGTGLATAALLVAGTLLAQEPTKTTTREPSAKVKSTRDPARVVPPYFGQIGITDEQRESIYKIQGKHLAKIEELEKQVDEIQAQMLKECEAVLTDLQKQSLSNRRKAAAEKKKGDSAEKKSRTPSK